MGATVKKVEQKNYTDLSGVFRAGMTKDELGGKKSIFIDYNKEFDRIDSDNDGVLSEQEITQELYADAEKSSEGVKKYSLFGMAFAGLCMLSNKLNKKTNKFTAAMLIFDLAVAAHFKYQEITAKKRIVQEIN